MHRVRPSSMRTLGDQCVQRCPTSWLVSTSQMPSQARSRNSSPGCSCWVRTSGQAVTIWASGPSPLFCNQHPHFRTRLGGLVPRDCAMLGSREQHEWFQRFRGP